MGFGAIWSAETRHDPFLPLAVASTTTARVGLGTAIAVARECVHPAVQEGLNRSGRSRADFTFRASTMVVLGDRRSAAVPRGR